MKLNNPNYLNGLVSSAGELDGSTLKSNKFIEFDFNNMTDNQTLPFTSMWGGTVGETAYPRVLNGKLTFAPITNGAAYAHYLHKKSVKRLCAKFSFSSFTTNNGSAVLIAWNGDIKDTYPVIPEGACHLSITASTWNYSIIDTGVVTTVASGLFVPALNINTDYNAEVILDRINSKAYVTLPDGQMVVVSHPKISFESKYSCFELFRTAATDSIASFSSCYASELGDSEIPRMMNKVQSAPKSSIVQYAPVTATYVTVPTTATEISAGNLIVPIRVPVSGKILVELSANLLQSATSNVLWTLTDDSAGSLATISVSESVKTGYVQTKVLLENLTVGRTLNIKWKHWTTVAGSATLKLSKSSGWFAVMIATPIE